MFPIQVANSQVVERSNANGRVLGQRINFVGQAAASSIRESLRANGFKGKDLTEQVNSVLLGKRSTAVVLLQGAIQAAHDKGYVPVHMDSNSKATVLTARWERPRVSAKVIDAEKVADELDKLQKENEALKAILKEKLGVTV